MSPDDKTSVVNMSVKQIFTRSCNRANAMGEGKFACLIRDDLMSKDDKAGVVKHECKINLYTIMYLHTRRKQGKFVCFGRKK